MGKMVVNCDKGQVIYAVSQNINCIMQLHKGGYSGALLLVVVPRESVFIDYTVNSCHDKKMIDCLGLWDFYGKDVCDKRMSDKTSSHHAISQGRLLTSIIAYCNVNSCHHDKMIDFLGFLWERWLC